MPTTESDQDSTAGLADKALVATMRNQRWQDFLFHKLTLGFALAVLLVLAGIIVSLIVGAWPAFREFGPGFVTADRVGSGQ